jgi:hypothetical protein
MLPFEEEAGCAVSYAFRLSEMAGCTPGATRESLWRYAEGELQCTGIHNIIWEKMKTDFHLVLFCAPPAQPNLLT